MSTTTVLYEALRNFADPLVWAAILGASVFGAIIGAIPGLTATMAAALLVPFAFFLPPLPAIAAYAAMSALAIGIGDLPTILVRMPGTPASAAYCDDGYFLAKQGKLATAAGIQILSDSLGGIGGALALIFLAPLLARVARNFSSFEFFWFSVLGLSCAAILSTGSLVKGCISLFIGLLLGTIGIDIVLGYPRFTFGNPNLLNGINFIPAMCGLFGLSEVLRNVVVMFSQKAEVETISVSIKEIWKEGWRKIKQYWVGGIRGTIVGIIIGALPGAGADIAAWVATALAKRFSKHPEKFGRGSEEALLDAGYANNAALGGTWIPALVFGIPGDTITAILIGVFMFHGLRPGPHLFTEQRVLLTSLYIVFIIVNLLIVFPLEASLYKIGSYLLRIPKSILMPMIVLMCIIGAYAINNNPFDIGIMLGMGILGFILQKYDFPVAPMVLGIVVGPMTEMYFMQSYIKTRGALLPFISRPASLAMALFTLFMWLYPLLTYVAKKVKTKAHDLQ